MLLLNLHHLLQVLRPTLQLRIGPVVNHLRRPIRIHNLARLRRVVLPVSEPLLEIIRFRLVLGRFLNIPGRFPSIFPVDIHPVLCYYVHREFSIGGPGNRAVYWGM